MFGIIRPCRHRLSSRLHAAWLAHLCGLCLALRDEHGQFARVVTNYDGLIISALVEAQTPRAEARRDAGPCPLRAMRGISVAHGGGAQLAAAVSLVLASAKMSDHIDDRDGAFGRKPIAAAARRVATRWAEQGGRTGARVGFDTSVITQAVDRQAEIERAVRLGDSALLATEPAELATAAAFAQTAVIAGRPGNAAPLAEAGRLFGRAAHLLDAVEDRVADEAAGAWNPLLITGTGLDEARRLCEDAVLGVELALREAEFADGALVHALLVHELRQAVRRSFGHDGLQGLQGLQGLHSHQQPPPGWIGPGPLPQQQPYPQQVPLPGHRPPPGAPGSGGEPPKPPKNPKRQGPKDGDGNWCWTPKFAIPAKKRNLVFGCAVASYMCCSCQFCCRDPYPGPWSGKQHEAWGCDCDCCDCCSCCDCSC
ncbi:DUF5685 family protein [Amycolatopsis sp. H20-H5]|uniref:DUF5685 family protein n=1 Tax=Amycolatopsis sp. H20-H5 TaxID=3046309 RepID=UPI002DB6A32D|nr:DUF5685 family protein [Amycolatopsis sp. H20-H5]MEC3974141.1 DUF5685 family protein [Amycolatopsis sp. H20-H5]